MNEKNPRKIQKTSRKSEKNPQVFAKKSAANSKNFAKNPAETFAKTDKILLFLKIAISIAALAIFFAQIGRKNLLGLLGILATIPLAFMVNFVEFFAKNKFSRELELAYLAFIFAASVLGIDFAFYNSGFFYDKIVHFFSGILTIFVARELFEKFAKKLPVFANFLFFIGISALVAILWETYEFSIDNLFGADMQRFREFGMSDTMFDMISAICGAVCAWIFSRKIEKSEKTFAKNKSVIK